MCGMQQTVAYWDRVLFRYLRNRNRMGVHVNTERREGRWDLKIR